MWGGVARGAWRGRCPAVARPVPGRFPERECRDDPSEARGRRAKVWPVACGVARPVPGRCPVPGCLVPGCSGAWCPVPGCPVLGARPVPVKKNRRAPRGRCEIIARTEREIRERMERELRENRERKK